MTLLVNWLDAPSSEGLWAEIMYCSFRTSCEAVSSRL